MFCRPASTGHDHVVGFDAVELAILSVDNPYGARPLRLAYMLDRDCSGMQPDTRSLARTIQSGEVHRRPANVRQGHSAGDGIRHQSFDYMPGDARISAWKHLRSGVVFPGQS